MHLSCINSHTFIHTQDPKKSIIMTQKGLMALMDFFLLHFFAGNHLVPKPKSQNEAWYRRTEERCWKCEGINRSEELLGKHHRYESFKDQKRCLLKAPAGDFWFANFCSWRLILFIDCVMVKGKLHQMKFWG